MLDWLTNLANFAILRAPRVCGHPRRANRRGGCAVPATPTAPARQERAQPAAPDGAKADRQKYTRNRTSFEIRAFRQNEILPSQVPPTPTKQLRFRDQWHGPARKRARCRPARFDDFLSNLAWPVAERPLTASIWQNTSKCIATCAEARFYWVFRARRCTWRGVPPSPPNAIEI